MAIWFELDLVHQVRHHDCLTPNSQFLTPARITNACSRVYERGIRIVTEAAELLQRIDDRTWRALPAELRWKIIPWAIDGGDLDAGRAVDRGDRAGAGRIGQADRAARAACRRAQ